MLFYVPRDYCFQLPADLGRQANNDVETSVNLSGYILKKFFYLGNLEKRFEQQYQIVPLRASMLLCFERPTLVSEKARINCWKTFFYLRLSPWIWAKTSLIFHLLIGQLQHIPSLRNHVFLAFEPTVRNLLSFLSSSFFWSIVLRNSSNSPRKRTCETIRKSTINDAVFEVHFQEYGNYTSTCGGYFWLPEYILTCSYIWNPVVKNISQML